MTNRLKIILLHVDGMSNRKIAAELGIDKNTVNTHVLEYDRAFEQALASDPTLTRDQIMAAIIQPPKYDVSSRAPNPETLKAMDVIRLCLEQNAVKRQNGRSKQQMTRKDIYRYLKDLGYSISYSSVKRLARELDDRPEEAFIQQDYSPGEVCEFDWGEVKLDIPDETGEKYQMAVFTPAYSNYRFARLYKAQDTAAFQEAHVDFFKHCNGVFHQLVYDNMKVAIKKFVGLSEKEPTEALVQLSGYYRFSFRFCNIKAGNEKGHVERSVDVVRRWAFSRPGKDRFSSLEEANEWLAEQCVKLNEEPLSDGSGRIPKELFAKEKYRLMTAPMMMSCYVKRLDLKVNKYSTVCVNTVRYSVPDKYVGKLMNARVYTDKVEIYCGEERVATHKRSFVNGSYHIDINHFLRTFKHKPGALAHSTALVQADASIRRIYETYYTTDVKSFLQVLELINEIGIDPVESALNTLIKMSTKDFNAQKVRMICDNNSEKNLNNRPGTDRLSEKSKETLANYDRLRELQSRKAV